MRECRWHQVSEHSGRVNREMELLRMNFMGHQGIDDELAVEVHDLQCHLSELQNQLSKHFNAVEPVFQGQGMQGVHARAMQ